MNRNGFFSSRSAMIVLISTVIVGIGLLGWWYSKIPANEYELAKGESVVNWDFQGAYEGNTTSEKKAQDEIAKLQSLVGSDNNLILDYERYVAIANQYDLLGEGRKEYENLSNAIAIDPDTTGIAWYNMAVLLEKYDAKKSARDAFARAAKAEPQQMQYQNAYLEFLTENFKEDTVAIDSAYEDAYAVFGDYATHLEIRARWNESIGRIQEALSDWKKVQMLSPTPGIDLEIKRLEGGL